jgi:hypothetical protein
VTAPSFPRLCIWERTISALRVIRSLLLLDGAVIVDKDERLLILGIGVSLRALVTWAQIASRVISGQGGLGRALLLSSVCAITWSMMFRHSRIFFQLTAMGA